MEFLQEFFAEYGNLLALGTWETILMTVASTLGAYVIGIPLGVALVLTGPKGLKPHRALNMVLGWIVNMGRSIPFIIMLVVLIPVTRIVMGTSLGVPGAIFPLIVSAAPFVARLVEQSIADVDGGLIEAAQSFGASTWQIVYKVFMLESLPSLIRGFAITFITLFGYTAMAGCIGAGGLGDIAVRYGYQRYQEDVMVATLIITVVLVQVIQSASDVVVRKVDKRR